MIMLPKELLYTPILRAADEEAKYISILNCKILNTALPSTHGELNLTTHTHTHTERERERDDDGADDDDDDDVFAFVVIRF